MNVYVKYVTLFLAKLLGQLIISFKVLCFDTLRTKLFPYWNGEEITSDTVYDM